MVAEPTTSNATSVPETTRDFRLQRKAIKEIFLKAPDGVNRDELERLAGMKGIKGEDFETVLESMLGSGHLYYDKALGKFRYVRNE